MSENVNGQPENKAAAIDDGIRGEGGVRLPPVQPSQQSETFMVT